MKQALSCLCLAATLALTATAWGRTDYGLCGQQRPLDSLVTSATVYKYRNDVVVSKGNGTYAGASASANHLGGKSSNSFTRVEFRCQGSDGITRPNPVDDNTNNGQSVTGTCPYDYAWNMYKSVSSAAVMACD